MSDPIDVYFLDYSNFNSDLNKEYLSEKKVSAVYFESIDSLLQMATVKKPKAIIYNLDLKKDDVGWYYVIQKKLPEIPVIVLSSSKTITKGRKLLQDGAFFNMRSPINMEELYYAIVRAIEFQKKGEPDHSKLDDEKSTTLNMLESLVEQSDGLLETLADSFPEKITVYNDVLLQKMIEMISSTLNVQIVSLLLIDPITNKLIITAQKGLPDVAKKNPSLKVGEGIAGYVAKTGQPILTDNVHKFSHLKIADYGKQYNTGSFISLPLKVGNRVIGVINVNNKKDGTSFTQVDLNILELLNAQILLSLRNAQLIHDQRKQIVSSKALNEIDQVILSEDHQELLFTAILGKCRELLNCESIILFMLDSKNSSETFYVRSFLSVKGRLSENIILSTSEGIEGMVFDVQKPVLISNADDDTRISPKVRTTVPGSIHNIAAYPILMYGRVAGVLEAINKIKKPKFEREDLYIMKQFTYKVFLGLMKNNLYREKASLNARLNALLNRANT
ncbi:MAG: GAF domain-containing protein [Acidobacteria bacterium]|nr:GAF domain-containing protein [Acidobacteriota bacterium]